MSDPAAAGAPGAEAALYRILDANLDRAREGLRVLEDLARFALDDVAVTARLKAIRHAISTRDHGLAVRLLGAREPVRDVGAAINSASEFERAGPRDLALANAKRLQEALRTLEEVSKAIPPTPGLDPAAFKAARFAAYQAEIDLVGRIGRVAARDRIRGLYFIVDPEHCAGRDPVAVTRAAIAGGATAVQLRDKIHDKGPLLRLAIDLQRVCREGGALFIVNDHVDVAVAADADGVHVGQQDLPVTVARAQMPIDRIVGCSTNNPDEAAAAVAAGADYVGVGAMYASGSKANTRPAGPERLAVVRPAVSVPIVAIGGITRDNVGPLARLGADAIAVIGAVGLADDPEAAARALTEAFRAGQPKAGES